LCAGAFQALAGSSRQQLFVFTDAPERLLDSLSPMPPDIQAEKDFSRLQRKFSLASFERLVLELTSRAVSAVAQ